MNDLIVILNFSDEYALETAKRLRSEQIDCRMISGMSTAAQVRELEPRGVILCGEDTEGSGVFDAGILEIDAPLLALGHTAHMLLAALGGATADVAISDKTTAVSYGESPLFHGLTGGERKFNKAYMLMLPPDVEMTASAGGCTVAFACEGRRQYGAQFQLERNDPDGAAILKNFAVDICGCKPWRTTYACLEEAIGSLNQAAAAGGRAICAVSGGVDSAVCAALAKRAFGERMTALLIDTGLMREGEADEVTRLYESLGIPLLRVDRSGIVLEALRGKTGMREKNAVVAACMEEEISAQAASMTEPVTLVLGTQYNDILSGKRTPWQGEVAAVEPIVTLMKEEVRAVARELKLPEQLVTRKPFPMLGLGARIVGEVTSERLHAIRVAGCIFEEEIEQAGLSRKLYKQFPVLASAGSLFGGEIIVLRAVTLTSAQLVPARLPYDVVERTVARIRTAAPQVVRVFYDETLTPIRREVFA